MLRKQTVQGVSMRSRERGRAELFEEQNPWSKVLAARLEAEAGEQPPAHPNTRATSPRGTRMCEWPCSYWGCPVGSEGFASIKPQTGSVQEQLGWPALACEPVSALLCGSRDPNPPSAVVPFLGVQPAGGIQHQQLSQASPPAQPVSATTELGQAPCALPNGRKTSHARQGVVQAGIKQTH